GGKPPTAAPQRESAHGCERQHGGYHDRSGKHACLQRQAGAPHSREVPRRQSAGAEANTLPSMVTWKLRSSFSPSQVEAGYQEVPGHAFQLPTIDLPPVASVTWNWQTLPGCTPVTLISICVPQGSGR